MAPLVIGLEAEQAGSILGDQAAQLVQHFDLSFQTAPILGEDSAVISKVSHWHEVVRHAEIAQMPAGDAGVAQRDRQ